MSGPEKSRDCSQSTRRRWPLAALGALLFASGLLLSLIVATPPERTGELGFSRFWLAFRSPAGDAFARFLEWFGGPECIPYVIALCALVLFVVKHRMLALLCLAMIFGAWTPNHLMKDAVTRGRPGPDLLPLTTYSDQHSYPSGHTAFAGAMAVFALFALAMWGTVRLWHVLLAVAYVVVMGLSRVYSGAHWLFDVVGGACISGGVALMMWPLAQLVWCAAQRRGGFWAEPPAKDSTSS